MTTPTTNSDIHWQQRQQNFERALEQLEQACQRLELNELEAQGLIKAFEYTHELAWNMLGGLSAFSGQLRIAWITRYATFGFRARADS